MIERIPELVNTDANLVRRGRFLSTTFLIEIGDKGYLVKIIEGPHRLCHARPVRDAELQLRAARAARRMGDRSGPRCRRPAITTFSRCSSAAS